ncbi:SchA/CurD-like domain-containing protein [Kitasatospora sp. NPDC002227]|uniref:SchA/CurD-like domain-containing protein n=1 Tax=Kitasatospora sp. NPDC002227 TaxID=3154773 RepID=UPI003328C54D
MTTLTHAPARRPAHTTTRLRVVLLCDIMDGAQQRFLEAYEQLRHQVAAVPGHVTDQLCQSIEDPSQWLITSEWESAQPFLAWVDSEAHRAMVKPLHGCVRDTRSLRFSVMRETSGSETFDSTQQPVLDGVVRHALTFTVKPGSEPEVARLLAGYSSPAARVDERTRLARTSLFMRGNRVVRSVEVEGDLGAALRHVAMQPEVRAVEEAINPYLEQDRDLTDPDSARAFFMRAALPAVHHTAADRVSGKVTRHALLYPVRPGCGAAVAALLARQDELAVREGGHPFAGSTVFQREDTVVRVVDLTADPESVPALALGVVGPRASGVLARLTELGGHDLRSPQGMARYAAGCAMALVTDRRAKGA